jgi:hypothetical protein
MKETGHRGGEEEKSGKWRQRERETYSGKKGGDGKINTEQKERQGR